MKSVDSDLSISQSSVTSKAKSSSSSSSTTGEVSQDEFRKQMPAPDGDNL